jgi:hypothetical protein
MLYLNFIICKLVEGQINFRLIMIGIYTSAWLILMRDSFLIQHFFLEQYNQFFPTNFREEEKEMKV